MLSNSEISLDWSITDEVTTRSTTAYFFGPPSVVTQCRVFWLIFSHHICFDEYGRNSLYFTRE